MANIFKTKDNVEIFYKDWGSGQPIVFSHGWPLSSDDWAVSVGPIVEIRLRETSLYVCASW